MEPETREPQISTAPRGLSSGTILLLGLVVLLLGVAIGGGYQLLSSNRVVPTPATTSLPTPAPTEEAVTEESPAQSKAPSPTPSPATSAAATATPTPTLTPTPTATASPTSSPAILQLQPKIFTIVPFAATAATAAVTPAGTSYACSPTSKTFAFTGSISANKAGTLTYQWRRSDGVVLPIQSMTFTTAGTKSTVNFSWTKTTSGTFDGWAQVRVLTPSVLNSNQASFSLACL